jgi:hypothetical protein
MIPAKADPRWKKVVTNVDSFTPQGLATKMLMMRVKQVVSQNPSPEKVEEAIGIAYDFFLKNEAILAADIKSLFG